MTADPRITLALTGASGMPYALTLLRALLEREQQVLLMLSDAAREVLRCEMEGWPGFWKNAPNYYLTNCYS